VRILGVDPGVGGGLVILEDRDPVLIVNYSTEQDFIDVVEKASSDKIDVAFIEKVNAFPGQGVASTWKFAQNYGFERGVIRTLKIPLYEVLPQKWQKSLGLPQVKIKTQRKAALKDAAGRFFPQHKWTLKNCDAALIALYGANTISNSETVT
jgi:hypothetical protein